MFREIIMMLFAEEASLLSDFFSAIALKGAMTTELKSETGTVVDDLVLAVNEEEVRCRMLDVHTRESVFLDVSFSPELPGDFEETMLVPIKDVVLINNIVSMFSKGETVYFEIEDDKLVIHNVENTISTSLPLADIESIMGFDEDVFQVFNIDDEIPSVETPAGAQVFNIHSKVTTSSMRIIRKLSSALKTPLVKISIENGDIFMNTTDMKSIRSASIKAVASPLKVLAEDEWVDSEDIAVNEYPIGLIPVLKQLDEADLYICSPEAGVIKQILFKGEQNRITKKYVIGPAGRMEDDE
jgi:hypothetical protein